MEWGQVDLHARVGGGGRGSVDVRGGGGAAQAAVGDVKGQLVAFQAEQAQTRRPNW